MYEGAKKRPNRLAVRTYRESRKGASMVQSFSLRGVIIVAAGLLVLSGCGCRKGECERGARKVTPAPAAQVTDVDAERVDHAIVVDFKDGTTQAQIDAWEKEWGVDL